MAIMMNMAIKASQDVGVILRVVRAGRGITQRKLAELSGVSQSLITKIEKGRIKNPRRRVRLALARALDQPPEVFVTDNELQKEERRADLTSMLVRCGVSERAAGLISRSIRERAVDDVGEALVKSGSEFQNEKRRADLTSMLIRCGVSERAARLISMSIQDRAVDDVNEALVKSGKEACQNDH